MDILRNVFQNRLFIFGFNFISLLCLVDESAQAGNDSASVRSWDLNFSIGRTVTYGDLTTGSFGQDGSWSFTAGGARYLSSWFALRGDLMFGNLHGDGSLEGSNTKYYFNSRMNFELTVSGQLQLGRFICKDNSYRLAIYTQAGFGFLNTTPQVFQRGFSGSANYFVDKDAGTSDPTADYKGLTHIVVPVGVGVKYRMTDRISGFLNGSYRITFTDEINGYVERPGTNDGFMVYGLGVTLHLGRAGKVHQWPVCGSVPVIDEKHAFTDTAQVSLEVNKVDSKTGIDSVLSEQNKQDERIEVAEDTSGAKGDFSDKEAEDFADILKSGELPAQEKIEENALIVQNVVPSPDSAKSKPTTLDKESGPASSKDNLPSIYFRTASYRVSHRYDSSLDAIAKFMAENPSVKLLLIGRTDAMADEEYNIKLGLRRAEAVKRKLIFKCHVPENRIEATSKGEVGSQGKDPSESRRVDALILR